MKLAAIYNVWDGEELLEGSMKSIADHVDYFIIVWQDKSNFGEEYTPILSDWILKYPNAIFPRFTPTHKDAQLSEKIKRNMGIQSALTLGCTHFLHMDCDEYYRDFGLAKQMYINTGADGSVVSLHTYFKKPTLRLDKPENYYVPFIHKLRHDTFAGGGAYPFYVDPTRRINELDVVELPFYMHHYSWVRKDIGRKVRNSTARKTIQGKHFEDYQRDLKAGDYLPCYERNLIEVEDYFNINSML